MWVKTPDGLLFAELTDLSAGGAFLEGVRARVGDELELVFRWLHSGELCLRAEVRHLHEHGVGVRFVQDDAVSRLIRLMPGGRV